MSDPKNISPANMGVDVALNMNQYFSFHLSGKIFAIPVMRITEIVEYGGVTNVPTMPDFIHGALNLRGNILPVIDLAKKLSLPVKPIHSRTCVVLLEVDMDGEMTQIGIIVDGVHQVVDLDMTSVNDAPSLGMDIKSEFVKGVVRIDEKVLTLLEVDTVFSMKEIAFSYSESA
jgi:purine-binding chemotaxis protein CheW